MEREKPLQRNAILALAHFKETSAIPDLIGVMKDDPRPVLRGTAAWALGKIGGDGVGEAIEKAMEREKDEEVLHEMNRGLELLAQKRVDNISFSYCNMGGDRMVVKRRLKTKYNNFSIYNGEKNECGWYC